MDHLAFVPSASEFFLWSDGALSSDALSHALRQAGWPTSAYLLDDGGRRQGDGFLIEMIDALPILGGPMRAPSPPGGPCAGWGWIWW